MYLDTYYLATYTYTLQNHFHERGYEFHKISPIVKLNEGALAKNFNETLSMFLLPPVGKFC